MEVFGSLVEPLPIAVAVGLVTTVGIFIRQRRSKPTRLLPFPPFPRGQRQHWLWGHAPLLPRDGSHIDPSLFEMSKAMDYAEVFTLKLPVVKKMIVVANPSMIHHITVSKNSKYIKSWTYEVVTMFKETSILRSHGDVWKNQRKAFAGGFTPKFLSQMVITMCEKLDRLLVSLDLDAQAGPSHVTTMLPKSQIFTSDVIIQIAFGEDWGDAYSLLNEEEEGEDNDGVKHNQRNFFSADSLPVPLFIPNLLGYARVVLAFVGLSISQSSPFHCTIIWIVSASLDLFDGLLARRLDQCSQFGVLLDICADNVFRSSLWMAAILSSVGLGDKIPPSESSDTTLLLFSEPTTVLMAACFVVSIEWTTMVCTQLHSKAGGDGGKHWKLCRENDPKFIQAIFTNNFRSPLGIICIYGLFGSGYMVYARNHPALVECIPFFDILFFLAMIGRIVAMTAEFWLCSGYLVMIIEQDSNSSAQATNVGNNSVSSRQADSSGQECRSGEDIKNGRAWMSEMSVLADKRINSPLMMIFGSRRLNELTNKMNLLLLGVLDRRLAEKHDDNASEKEKPKDVCSLAIESFRNQSDTDHLTTDQKLEIVEQLKTFYFAGHDTTATTIAWATWLLSQHPEVLSKLRQELDDHGIFSDLKKPSDSNSSPIDSDMSPTYEQLNNCPYLDSVLKETLRLYPPGGSARYTVDANESYNGMRLGGAVLYVCPYILHRLPQHWERPDDFWPERFVNVPVAEYANKFLPFSKGPRDCLGKYFALLEGKLAIAALAQRYDMSCVDPDEKIGVQLTARPMKGAKVNISMRS